MSTLSLGIELGCLVFASCLLHYQHSNPVLNQHLNHLSKYYKGRALSCGDKNIKQKQQHNNHNIEC